MTDHEKEFYASSNGDRWLITRSASAHGPVVVHRANQPSGGQTEHFDLTSFLIRSKGSPQADALLALLSSNLPDA